MFELNWFAIIGVVVANLVIGMVWYHPKVFGDMWMRLSGVNPDRDAAKRRMPVMMIMAAISSAIMAYVLTHFAVAWHVFDIFSAVELAFWTWLGFIATTQISVVLWEMKPWRLFFINTGYSLVSLIIASIILVSFS